LRLIASVTFKINMKFKQYSVVRIKKINKEFDENDISFNNQLPQIGDIATIVEVYENPNLGYELECPNDDGTYKWLMTFSSTEIDLELIKEF